MTSLQSPTGGGLPPPVRAFRVSVVTVMVLAATAVAAPSPAAPDARVARQVAALVAEPAPGTYVGPGFDACSAPSTATMRAWLASPYRAVGIYFGEPR